MIRLAHKTGISRLMMACRNVNTTLVEALLVAAYDDTAFGKDASWPLNEMHLCDAIQQMGPMSRISALREAAADSHRLLRFVSGGAHDNVIQQVRFALPAGASGVRSYISFCTLLGISPFPSSAESVGRRSAIFAHGRT